MNDGYIAQHSGGVGRGVSGGGEGAGHTISYELLFQDQFETLLNFCRTRVQRLDAVSPTTPRPAGRRCHPASIHTLPRCLVPAGGKCITWGFPASSFTQTHTL